ncbi:hypothetical protein M758_7G110800 [Ceratodon purpureus]|uniref:Uncharacterized protein n=1 Tax=Ceratodon purpureus TaxID=3225 RepID=A0A8T0HBR8_CERPU|nr:hypothetical protein KC19_7G165600 [Ceratodon purpureus]KAG0611051.1 hypothetical protein M758_7G110800 [Ceratodon purpureus]
MGYRRMHQVACLLTVACVFQAQLNSEVTKALLVQVPAHIIHRKYQFINTRRQ